MNLSPGAPAFKTLDKHFSVPRAILGPSRAPSSLLKLLALNPRHPFLRLHRLNGRLKQLHSVCINMRTRITFEFIIRDHKIVLVDIGEHAAVYT